MHYDMRDLLQEWMRWLNTYYAFIGPVGDVDKLYKRTEEVVSKSNWSKYI